MNDSTTQTKWTVGQLLNWTSQYLREHGSQEHRLDAEILLANARNCQRIELYTDFDQPVDAQTRSTFRQLVRRRADGTPVAYLVGHREFYSLEFEVDRHVLIPRPETELLVLNLLDLVKSRTEPDQPFEIADLGTGSGVLAVCAAKHLPASQITAIDISAEALSVARRNAVTHRVDSRIEFIQSDLLEQLETDRDFDFLLSNPPYVREDEYRQLPVEVRDHEPRGALLAGPAGTEVIERIIEHSAARLRPAGWLLLEISPMIEERVGQLLAHQPHLENCRVVKDLAGMSRLYLARRKQA